MPCMANSTPFLCGPLLFPLSHERGREPSLQAPILVCMNRPVHTAIEASEYLQKNLWFSGWPQFLCTHQGWEQTSFVGRLKRDQCQAMDMVGRSGAPGGEEGWKESGFVGMEKGCLREALIADVQWLTDCYQPSLGNSQGCHRTKRDTWQHRKFCLHIKSETTVVHSWDRARRGGGTSTAGHVQNLAGQGADQADFVLKAVELGKGNGNKDLQMCLPTWMFPWFYVHSLQLPVMC